MQKFLLFCKGYGQVEADPALVYVFHKTGVYVSEENYG